MEREGEEGKREGEEEGEEEEEVEVENPSSSNSVVSFKDSVKRQLFRS